MSTTPNPDCPASESSPPRSLWERLPPIEDVVTGGISLAAGFTAAWCYQTPDGPEQLRQLLLRLLSA
jgi:hypothetical protein